MRIAATVLVLVLAACDTPTPGQTEPTTAPPVCLTTSGLDPTPLCDIARVFGASATYAFESLEDDGDDTIAVARRVASWTGDAPAALSVRIPRVSACPGPSGDDRGQLAAMASHWRIGDRIGVLFYRSEEPPADSLALWGSATEIIRFEDGAWTNHHFTWPSLDAARDAMLASARDHCGPASTR